MGKLTDTELAMLGDHATQNRITERGELLPRPFCGGTAMENDNWVYCDGCGVGFEIRNKKLRRRIWNTRAPILTPEQVKRLEEIE